ncbi:hypothetical protein BRD10_04810 [Halobacteriales archaeon SW_12_71_31]|nr:MAG: hypothetical protein BRD10_04810 [Halobacteriales archaeon SW_12_71_31]
MVEVDPLQDAIESAKLFTDVALSDPLSAVLVALGGLLTAVAVAVFGGLSAGGLVSYVLRLLERPDRPD